MPAIYLTSSSTSLPVVLGKLAWSVQLVWKMCADGKEVVIQSRITVFKGKMEKRHTVWTRPPISLFLKLYAVVSVWHRILSCNCYKRTREWGPWKRCFTMRMRRQNVFEQLLHKNRFTQSCNTHYRISSALGNELQDKSYFLLLDMTTFFPGLSTIKVAVRDEKSGCCKCKDRASQDK